VGVIHAAHAAQGLAQGAASEGIGQRLRQRLLHMAVGAHRQCLSSGQRPVVAPELLVQPIGFQPDLDQRGGGDLGTEQAGSNAIRLVLVLSRDGEGPGHKAREVPIQESLRQHRGEPVALLQALVEPAPADARSVDPGGETPVVAAQVTVFVREHGQQLLPVERHQQRQAQGQIVAGAAEQPPARQLADAGVQVVGQEDLVDGRPLDLAPDSLQRLEQRRRVLVRDAHALWRIQAEPQRAKAGPQQAGAREGRHDVVAADAAMQHGVPGPPQHAHGREHADHHPRVPE
jgi:hypothetical protein